MTTDISHRMLSRRAMLRVAVLGGVAAVAAGCTRSSPPPRPSPSPGTLRYLKQGAETLSLLTGLGDNPADAIQTGRSTYIFDLSSGPTSLLQGGTPQVYFAKSMNSKAMGPFPMQWTLFTGYDKTGDTSPKSPIPGIYWGELDVTRPGDWIAAAVAKDGSKTGVGIAAAMVSDHVVAPVGSKAKSVPTPVATTPEAIAKICTRVPVDHMHYISLDEALTNGKPTVVSFATPKFCESSMCGPVVDEQILAFEKIGKDKANFIHVEEFPTRDLTVQSPPFVAWRLRTEPWVFVIDKTGVIRARFLGPAVAPMIESAVTRLL
jgi:hypothetical protein